MEKKIKLTFEEFIKIISQEQKTSKRIDTLCELGLYNLTESLLEEFPRSNTLEFIMAQNSKCKNGYDDEIFWDLVQSNKPAEDIAAMYWSGFENNE